MCAFSLNKYFSYLHVLEMVWKYSIKDKDILLLKCIKNYLIIYIYVYYNSIHLISRKKLILMPSK